MKGLSIVGKIWRALIIAYQTLKVGGVYILKGKEG